MGIIQLGVLQVGVVHSSMVHGLQWSSIQVSEISIRGTSLQKPLKKRNRNFLLEGHEVASQNLPLCAHPKMLDCGSSLDYRSVGLSVPVMQPSNGYQTSLVMKSIDLVAI